jgi:hypothetical protein
LEKGANKARIRTRRTTGRNRKKSNEHPKNELLCYSTGEEEIKRKEEVYMRH